MDGFMSMTTFPALHRALATRRGRLVLENLTAYLFLAPAGLLIILFGIFPVAFAFFVSLHRWRRFPDEYVGLANYEKALGNLGYILFFWLAFAAFAAAIALGRRLLIRTKTSTSGRFASVVAGVACGYAALLAIDWFFKLTPVIMLIPRQVRGQNTTLALFMEKLGESFANADVYAAGNLMLGGLLVACLAVIIVAWRFGAAHNGPLVAISAITTALLCAGFFLLHLTITETDAAIAAARESGESLPIWSQLVFISAGVALIASAWLIFRRGIRNYDNRTLCRACRQWANVGCWRLSLAGGGAGCIDGS